MSGGSFDYLYCSDLTNKESTIEQMAKALDDLGEHEAARRTRIVLDCLKMATSVQNELSGVWHAVEWERSGDGYSGQISDAIAKWKASTK